MQKTIRERLESLLKIHGGHCFIVEACADFAAFKQVAEAMQAEGLITVEAGGGHVKGLDVKKKGWRPQRGPIEREEPTH